MRCSVDLPAVGWGCIELRGARHQAVHAASSSALRLHEFSGRSAACCRDSTVCSPRRLVRAACPCSQEQVEPLMDMYKPPGLIKKIYFQKLTFGDDPFRCVPAAPGLALVVGSLWVAVGSGVRRRPACAQPSAVLPQCSRVPPDPMPARSVEGIRVDKTNPDEVCLEVSQGQLPYAWPAWPYMCHAATHCWLHAFPFLTNTIGILLSLAFRCPRLTRNLCHTPTG